MQWVEFQLRYSNSQPFYCTMHTHLSVLLLISLLKIKWEHAHIQLTTWMKLVGVRYHIHVLQTSETCNNIYFSSMPKITTTILFRYSYNILIVTNYFNFLIFFSILAKSSLLPTTSQILPSNAESRCMLIQFTSSLDIITPAVNHANVHVMHLNNSLLPVNS